MSFIRRKKKIILKYFEIGYQYEYEWNAFQCFSMLFNAFNVFVLFHNLFQNIESEYQSEID